MKSKIFTLVMFGILLVSIVSALGVTHPQPQNIELKPGQSGFFTLQVQADDFPLKCVPIIRDNGGLELAFNQEYNIEANQDFIIQPQVIVPDKASFGDHQANFCLECAPTGEVVGSRVIPVICDLPVTVDVVSDRTRVNKFEDTGQLGFIAVLTILSISILILAIVVFYLVVRKRRNTMVVSSVRTK
jgi:hypothetical protein